MFLQLGKSSTDRMGAIIASVSTLAFSGFMFYAFASLVPRGDGKFVPTMFRFLMLEVYFASSLFALLGLIWGMFAPKWMIAWIQTAARRAVFLCGVVLLAGVAAGLYLLLLQ